MKRLTTILLLIISISVYAQRSNSIEIHFTNGIIPAEVRSNYDIEFSSKEGTEILWIHPDGWKEFNRELFLYMDEVTKVVNRKALHDGCEFVDYLNLYIVSETLEEMGMQAGGNYYKNVKWSEINNYNVNDLLLKREVEQLNQEL